MNHGVIDDKLNALIDIVDRQHLFQPPLELGLTLPLFADSVRAYPI